MQDSLVSVTSNAHLTPSPSLHFFVIHPASTQRITNGMTMTGRITGRRQDNPKVQVQKRCRRKIQIFVAQWCPVYWRHKEAVIGRRRHGINGGDGFFLRLTPPAVYLHRQDFGIAQGLRQGHSSSASQGEQGMHFSAVIQSTHPPPPPPPPPQPPPPPPPPQRAYHKHKQIMIR